MASARFEQGTVTLDSGDLLVVFTDRVTEAENERQEEYGEPRLLEVSRGMSVAGSTGNSKPPARRSGRTQARPPANLAV